jgi:hypothetical protein
VIARHREQGIDYEIQRWTLPAQDPGSG